jgi:mono/diheme cytochrome c family protein
MDHHLHHSDGFVGSGVCPQLRATARAPDEIYNLKNPVEPSMENAFRGESFFQTDAQPTACKVCHGSVGNGMGMMAQGLQPPPRNFTCSETMKEIPDGQLFWIIKNGSPGTGMPAYKDLNDEAVWQIIHYIRRLGK